MILSGIKTLKSSDTFLGLWKATHMLSAVHLQRKDKRKALSSHFWLTLRVCTTRKGGRVENCLVEL